MIELQCFHFISPDFLCFCSFQPSKEQNQENAYVDKVQNLLFILESENRYPIWKKPDHTCFRIVSCMRFCWRCTLDCLDFMQCIYLTVRKLLSCLAFHKKWLSKERKKKLERPLETRNLSKTFL